MYDIIPVILCGGRGTRLWPLSRESHPKQFVDLGGGRTLFMETLERASVIADNIEPVVVCNEKYLFYVQDGLRECSMKGLLLLEPAPRNTAPAIAMAARSILESGGDNLMLVLPSDHHLNDIRVFVKAVESAVPLAMEGYIVTFGMPPDSAATGFGYIRQGHALDEYGYKVMEFVEEPALEKACSMLNAGGYFWNSGMFMGRPSVFLEELEKYAPEIFRRTALAWQNREMDQVIIRPSKSDFLSCPDESIDYALMEHTTRVAMIPVLTTWNDMGSWDSFFQDASKDAYNNACQGDVILDNVRDCYVHSCGRLIAAIGISGLMVIETKDSVLVTTRHESQKVKNIVKSLKKSGRYQYRQHPLVYRPWGSYETLAFGDRFQVKRIVVNPGEILSLQLHHHRAEHWIVVRGTAEITNGDCVTIYTENQSTYIPVGCRHRLRNPGVIPLVLIEIQSGAYLGEDDIVRLEDVLRT